MDIEVVFSVLARFIHMICGIVLLGPPLYSWLTKTPIARSLKGPILAACGFIIVSGGYTLMTKKAPEGYHMWFGIKLLFVMHIIGVHFVMAIQEMSDAKRVRLATGIVYSGLAVFLLSAILRWKSVGF